MPVIRHILLLYTKRHIPGICRSRSTTGNSSKRQPRSLYKQTINKQDKLIQQMKKTEEERTGAQAVGQNLSQRLTFRCCCDTPRSNDILLASSGRPTADHKKPRRQHVFKKGNTLRGGKCMKKTKMCAFSMGGNRKISK